MIGAVVRQRPPDARMQEILEKWRAWESSEAQKSYLTQNIIERKKAIWVNEEDYPL